MALDYINTREYLLGLQQEDLIYLFEGNRDINEEEYQDLEEEIFLELEDDDGDDDEFVEKKFLCSPLKSMKKVKRFWSQILTTCILL